MSGYEWFFDKQLLSLFSAPAYCGADNKGAFALLHKSGMCIYVFGGSREKYELIKRESIYI
jgi:serine/threonine-protein phosphatase PP1 catalytic subunit